MTFVGFASRLLAAFDGIPGLTAADKAAARKMLAERGLSDQTPDLRVGWMGQGAGVNFRITTTPTPRMRVMDNPTILKKWLSSAVGEDNAEIMVSPDQISTSNLGPGKVAAIWFDIQNNQPLSAGGVLLTVTSLDPDVILLSSPVNVGSLIQSARGETQIMYEKINGTAIVNSMSGLTGALTGPFTGPLTGVLTGPFTADETIPLGNSYFKTNPYFDATWRTAVWVKVRSVAARGKAVSFEVRATPSNGDTDTHKFQTEIN